MMRRLPMIVGPLVGGWLISHFGWQHGTRRFPICHAASPFGYSEAQSPLVEIYLDRSER
jgi:hypothetical protein